MGVRLDVPVALQPEPGLFLVNEILRYDCLYGESDHHTTTQKMMDKYACPGLDSKESLLGCAATRTGLCFNDQVWKWCPLVRGSIIKRKAVQYRRLIEA